MSETRFIEWDVPQPPLRERLVVERRGKGVDEAIPRRGATLEDLRMACVAAGLHVATQEENAERVAQARQAAAAFDLQLASSKSYERQLSAALAELKTLREGQRSLVERAEKAEATVTYQHESTLVMAKDLRLLRERAEYAEASLVAVRLALDPLSHESKVGLVDMASATVKAVVAEAARAARFENEVTDLRTSWKEAVSRAENAEVERDKALEHKLAALTSPDGRASDEELRKGIEGLIHRFDVVTAAGLRDLLSSADAAASRVRRERPACLVERLVAAGYDFEVEEEGGGYWTVATRSAATPVSHRTKAEAVPASDVPATLARLAGLDGGK